MGNSQYTIVYLKTFYQFFFPTLLNSSTVSGGASSGDVFYQVSLPAHFFLFPPSLLSLLFFSTPTSIYAIYTSCFALITWALWPEHSTPSFTSLYSLCVCISLISLFLLPSVYLSATVSFPLPVLYLSLFISICVPPLPPPPFQFLCYACILG